MGIDRCGNVGRFLLICGAFLVPVWGYTATSAVTWMRTLDLETFRTAADVWGYLAGLRTGIPPVLSTLELLWWVNFRDLTLFSDLLYPLTVASAFALAVLIQPERFRLRAAVLILGLFLAHRGVAVHAGNPANYDPLFALLTLGYFLLVRAWLRDRRPGRLAAAGLCLSLLELTRPFMIFLLPLFLAVEVHRIARTAPGRAGALAAFLIPVAILSGGWHLHVWLAHDHQIAWTNVSGFNLQRAWEDFDPDIRSARRLEELPRVREGADELWADLNTSEVYRESEALKSLIVARILEDPVRAAGHVLDRLAVFASAPTRMYDRDPQGIGILAYRGVVTVLLLTMAGYAAVGAAVLIRRGCWPWLDQRWWLAASTLLVVILVSIGERGEEGRFIFSILPMLLAVGGFALASVPNSGRAGKSRPVSS
ncbi:hypothetical protein IGS68_10340 [Skermanella sp. TT6]|uniref:Glycosyltransferase RgtA/B/C/D-like domain-containing protein n=1 Tax=Skermanella cutis TaxID=2775420 RepID=A0ABX7BBK4_9PROT|nr:hypothetical protein [Skermanella sp. TT6]QQP91572.1 hypothetical protein IGS68_10340 [Skermanella sp. TT6]